MPEGLQQDMARGTGQASVKCFKIRVASQNVEGAVGYFVPRAQERYRDIFTFIRDQLPQTVQDMQNIEFIYLKNKKGKKALLFSTTKGII